MTEQLGYVNEAELDLGACLLVEPEKAFPEVQEELTPGEISNDRVRAICLATEALVRENKPADVTMIQAKAVELGLDLPVEYCAELMQTRYLTVANVKNTAHLVHEAAIQRRESAVGLRLMNNEMDASEAIGALQELLTGRTERLHSSQEDAQRFMDFVSDVYAGQGKPFLPTGFPSLDAQLGGGLAASGMITLAARPGTGKTTVALNLAEKVAMAGGHVLYESLEMSMEQLWARRVAALTGLGYSDIYRGNTNGQQHLTEEDFTTVYNGISALFGRSLQIVSAPSTMADIERDLRRTKGVDLLVIDHIGLIRQNPKHRLSNRYEFMTEQSHAIKQLAISTGVPILALCQLNRNAEAREDKRPTMADLRDTGAIEEDSDAVILLHRPAQYEENYEPFEDQELHFIVAKNRHAMQGEVILSFHGIDSLVKE